ncbi:glycosyltransferase 61 family protein [Synechococcus sp. R50.1]|uniref:glycosyltransferase 61 family protein n=1 Tax=Synechococcus sp. R50.1 TaxID=2969649 RepID=UPI0039C4ACB0
MQFVTLFLIHKDMAPNPALPSHLLSSAFLLEDWEQGHYERVTQVLQQQLEQGSPSPELYWELGAAYLLLGRELEAQLVWQEGLAMLQAGGVAESEAVYHLLRSLQALAESLWEKGHWPQAAALYRQLLELGDGQLELSSGQALAAHRIGLTQERSRLWAAAAEWFERACQQDPTAAESFWRWGLALMKLGRLREAISPLQEAARLRPEWGDPWVQMGLAWLDLRDPVQAVGCFQEAEARGTGTAQLYSYWAEAEVRLAHPEAAWEKVCRAVAAERNWVQAWCEGSGRESPLRSGLEQACRGEGSARIPDFLYSAWRQRWAPEGVALQADSFSQNTPPTTDFWPVPTQGYLTTRQWHQATGEGDYQPLDPVGVLCLKAPPAADPAILQKLRPQRIPLAETFVAQIPRGSVHVGHYPRHLYASFASGVLTRRGELLADLSLSLPPPEFLDWDYRPDHLRHHPLLGLPHLPPPIPLDGPVALLPLGAVNYFHWMVDILPALDILQRSGALEKDIPILIHGYQRKPFQVQSLAALGIPAERILSFEQLGGSHLQAQNLIVPSAGAPVGCLTPRGLEVLRQLAQPSLSIDPLQPRRIYICRRSARWRRVINEAEVLACLHPWGFAPVQMETLSLQEQIALMQGAEAVIGIHGAGLTNLAFCQPGTTVIEILPSNAVLPYFWSIAQVAGLRYFPLVAPVCDPALVALLSSPDLDREDAWVRIPDLLNVLEQTGIKG